MTTWSVWLHTCKKTYQPGLKWQTTVGHLWTSCRFFISDSRWDPDFTVNFSGCVVLCYCAESQWTCPYMVFSLWCVLWLIHTWGTTPQISGALPWWKGKQALVSGARSHAPADRQRTSPPPLPHRSSSHTPYWRGCATRRRWWRHIGVWAATRCGKKNAQVVNKTKKTNAQEEATTQKYRRQLHMNFNVRGSAYYARVAVFVFSGCRKKLWPPPSLARRRCLRIARRLVGCRSCF